MRPTGDLSIDWPEVLVSQAIVVEQYGSPDAFTRGTAKVCNPYPREVRMARRAKTDDVLNALKLRVHAPRVFPLRVF